MMFFLFMLIPCLIWWTNIKVWLHNKKMGADVSRIYLVGGLVAVIAGFSAGFGYWSLVLFLTDTIFIERLWGLLKEKKMFGEHE